MRIATDSAAELVLTSGFIVLSTLFGLLAAVLVGAAIMMRVPALLGGAGLWALFAVLSMRTYSRVRFDKRARTVTIDRLKWFRHSRVRLAFDDITDVVIELNPTAPPPNMSYYTSFIGTGRMCLSTKQGPLRLADLYDIDPRYDSDRRAILVALGRPIPEAPRDQSVLHLVQAGRITEAVELLRAREKLDLATAQARIADMERQVAIDEQRAPK